jgi:membrane protein DedA with SNARE-associated domain
VSKTDLGLKKFARYDAVAVIAWLLVVIPIGFISGLGFTYLAEAIHNLYIEIGLILLIIFIIIIIQIWLEKMFVKKETGIKL